MKLLCYDQGGMYYTILHSTIHLEFQLEHGNNHLILLTTFESFIKMSGKYKILPMVRLFDNGCMKGIDIFILPAKIKIE